jgi:hypothetical protein
VVARYRNGCVFVTAQYGWIMTQRQRSPDKQLAPSCQCTGLAGRTKVKANSLPESIQQRNTPHQIKTARF